MIYLDANATTKPDPQVVEAILPYLTDIYGNASSGHQLGRKARKGLEKARSQVADLMKVSTEEIIFTSGATESINSVLSFVQHEYPERPLLIISAVEHEAVLECASRWENDGGRVKRVAVDAYGRLDLEELQDAIEPGKTALISMIWANNETGVITPLAEVVELAHEAGALVHADAAQMVGRLPVNLSSMAVDYLSLSAHKFHGLKGTGALFVSRRVPFRPWILGGGQERGWRSGTENVTGIVALGLAAEKAAQRFAVGSHESVAHLRDGFEQKLAAEMPQMMIHGQKASRLPNTSSICLPGVDAAGMVILLDQKGIACSGGSACRSASLHPSHVLEAMGFNTEHALSTLRFSLSADTTEAELMEAAEHIISSAGHLCQQRDSLVSF
jgi:cysteine desulfurase